MMTKDKLVGYGASVLFIGLGLALLGTLLNFYDSAFIYKIIVPLTLLGAGVALLGNNPSERTRRSVALGLIVFGLVSLLIQFEVLRGDVVNAIVGVAFVSAGVFMVSRLTDRKSRNDTEVDDISVV
ncbi:hypothetical protein A2791_05405 [Candidatus Saccharibacteria bacterium RIFCSPHIGHO2_01_FULL_46_30]|nr:MAG: hypothetical protein A2791_05405 [Candidatus Saccharibacteria bacterium RIFCSPHIGHO2_01_FULL_46_30]